MPPKCLTVCFILACIHLQDTVCQAFSKQESILKRLDAMEMKQREADQEILRLRKADYYNKRLIHQQANKINRLEENAVILQKEVSTLKIDMGRNRYKINKVHMIFITRDHVIPKLRPMLKEIVAQDEPAKPKIREERHVNNFNPQASLNIQQRATEGKAAFTVYLDHDVDLGAGQTVKYNKILLNEGNGYSVHTGAFTCSQSGVYLFNFFTGIYSSTGYLIVSLMVNGNRQVDSIIESKVDYHGYQSGNAAMVRLNIGDAVWIEQHSGSHLEGMNDYRFTTFSGVFLFA